MCIRDSYEAAAAYEVEISLDVAAGRYSATVDGTLLADDYAFRLDEASLGRIVAWHSTGSIGVTDIVVEGSVEKPAEGCIEDIVPVEPPVDDVAEQEGDATVIPDAPADVVDVTGDATPPPDAAADDEPEGGGASGGCGCSVIPE